MLWFVAGFAGVAISNLQNPIVINCKSKIRTCYFVIVSLYIYCDQLISELSNIRIRCKSFCPNLLHIVLGFSVSNAASNA
mmetsp:Transcript_21081/g.58087  ORF Transcript_21081/g.58087 Transcript_21081/m.58087 type:complete len:80 (-) Transcript_21081:725-964(-)